jgi:hypothetical protein
LRRFRYDQEYLRVVWSEDSIVNPCWKSVVLLAASWRCMEPRGHRQGYSTGGALRPSLIHSIQDIDLRKSLLTMMQNV